MPHAPLGAVCTAASVHLAAAVANFAWLECRNSPTEQLGFGDPATYPKQIGTDGAFYRVPDEPGLGVEVNESLLQASSFEYTEPPHLRRDDGSFTNW
jgi:galactonate dehydratase